MMRTMITRHAFNLSAHRLMSLFLSYPPNSFGKILEFRVKVSREMCVYYSNTIFNQIKEHTRRNMRSQVNTD